MIQFIGRFFASVRLTIVLLLGWRRGLGRRSGAVLLALYPVFAVAVVVL